MQKIIVLLMAAFMVVTPVLATAAGGKEAGAVAVLSFSIKHGVTHYCVPNVPSSVARTASHAFSNVVLPFLVEIGESGVMAFRENAALRRGTYLYTGRCTHAGLADLLGWEYESIDSLA